MPTPNATETRVEFVNRCMGDAEARRDFPDQGQRAAFCYSVWESSRKDDPETPREGFTHGTD